MGPHEAFEFQWAGKKYSVPSDQQTKVVAAIEDVVTADELARVLARNSIPRAKIAMAYGILLRHVGVKITDNEVRADLFRDAKPKATIQLVVILLAFMAPELVTPTNGAGPNPTRDEVSKSADSSSRKSTSKQSATVG